MYDEQFITAILKDLRRAASDFLDPIRAKTATAVLSTGDSSPISILIDRLTYLESLTPTLLDDARTSNLSNRHELIVSPTPLHAVPSLDAHDYVLSGRELVPRSYFSVEPLLEIDARPLAWLLGICEDLGTQLEVAIKRLGKHLQDAIQEPAFGPFARQAQEELARFAQGAENARARALRLARTILEAASWRIHPTSVPPSPYPESESWRRMRTLAADILDPRSLALAVAGQLADSRHKIADLGFLYQRWCGIKIIQAMNDSGWRTDTDAMPAILVGGHIQFIYEDKHRLTGNRQTIDLWCEPHFARHGSHPSGINSQRAESGPDFIFITPGPSGPDAFALDPTLSSSDEARAKKKVYLTDLSFDRMSTVAGVPIRIQQRPLRSWAAAPLDRSHCVLESADGASGTVPLRPDMSTDALRAWLGDVVRHALAWG